jgi:16S rRNA (uracil1498-N3)-methyltransferase
MSLKSVYLPEPRIDGEILHITGDEHHHLTVGRAAPDEMLEVFDGRGNVWTARVVSLGRREATVQVLTSRFVDPPAVEVILGLALIRQAAFELALEKVVEVGVNRVVPFVAERSNVPPGNRQERWSRIIIEAAKQSKRYHLPVVDEPVPFSRIVEMHASSKIMFAQHVGGPLKSALFGSPVLYLIGPEGGWTEAEVALAQRHGFRAVTLGAGILRAETAAIAGASLIHYELGAG